MKCEPNYQMIAKLNSHNLTVNGRVCGVYIASRGIPASYGV